MNLEQLTKILTRAKRLQLIGGVVVIAISVPVIYTAYFNGASMFVWIFSIFMLLVSVVSIILAIISILKFKNGRAGLLNAIKTFDKGFIVWINKRNPIVTTKDGKNAKDCEVELCDRKGKISTIYVKSDELAEDVTKYLITQFPDALVGDSPSNVELLKQRFNRKVW